MSIRLIFLVLTEGICKLLASDKQNREHGFHYLFSDTYIRAAGGHPVMGSVFVATHCLRLFFCLYSSLSKSSDT
jgi:hypothetical protein